MRHPNNLESTCKFQSCSHMYHAQSNHEGVHFHRPPWDLRVIYIPADHTLDLSNRGHRDNPITCLHPRVWSTQPPLALPAFESVDKTRDCCSPQDTSAADMPYRHSVHNTHTRHSPCCNTLYSSTLPMVLDRSARPHHDTSKHNPWDKLAMSSQRPSTLLLH